MKLLLLVLLLTAGIGNAQSGNSETEKAIKQVMLDQTAACRKSRYLHFPCKAGTDDPYSNFTIHITTNLQTSGH